MSEKEKNLYMHAKPCAVCENPKHTAARCPKVRVLRFDTQGNVIGFELARGVSKDELQDKDGTHKM